MKVRNKATGEHFYIVNTDAPKIGQPVTVPVYDHEPHGKGSSATFANGVQMFVDYRHASKPVKKFRADFLESRNE